uniref:Uncharacterized protein n=1 Tax=Opuntia streptacantha TaxID=393608 RepID=A0A7C9D4U8_OPUST
MASGKAGKFSDHGRSNGPRSSDETYVGSFSSVGSRLSPRTRTDTRRSSPAGRRDFHRRRCLRKLRREASRELGLRRRTRLQEKLGQAGWTSRRLGRGIRADP